MGITSFVIQLNPSFQPTPGTSDGYGIEMVNNLMSISSNSNGTANFTDLEIAYDIEFAVTTSAGTIGSLSNSLNQQMLPGSGAFTVTLPVETTKSGQFDATYLSMNYTLGAPNLALPPTPLLSVQSLTESSVTIEWQALSEFGNDLQEFQVFRMSPTAGYDYTSPYEVVVGQNTFSDSNVDVGSTYGYIVRSIHSFGVVSNLSQALEVTIPNPPAPAAVTNVQLFDLDMETASAPIESNVGCEHGFQRCGIQGLCSRFGFGCHGPQQRVDASKGLRYRWRHLSSSSNRLVLSHRGRDFLHQ